MEPILSEEFIPKLLELPNFKANLEEFEIQSKNDIYIERFIENWKGYNQFTKLNKVTFT